MYHSPRESWVNLAFSKTAVIPALIDLADLSGDLAGAFWKRSYVI
jgi:hypothetical protein